MLLNFQDRSYYQVVRDLADDMKMKGLQYDSSKTDAYYMMMARNYLNDDSNPLGEVKVGKIVARPVDKREHYVKRCSNT